MSGSLGNKEVMAKNIRRHLNKLGLNVKDFATEMNFKYSTVLDWVNAKTYPRIDKIELMANYFKIEKADLIEDKTEKQEDIDDSLISQINTKVTKLHKTRQKKVLTYTDKQLEEQKAEENSYNTVNEPQVIYYTYNYYDQPASAGTGQYLNDVQVEQIELPIDVDADFVVPIYGDSMEPEYHSGDYVFVKLSVDLSSGDVGVFELYGDAYIKELIIDDSKAYLHSFNTEKYKDIPIDADSDFRIIGEVVGKYSEN